MNEVAEDSVENLQGPQLFLFILHTFFIPFCVSQEGYIRIYPFYCPVLTVHLCFNDKQSHRDASLAVSICRAWGLRSID